MRQIRIHSIAIIPLPPITPLPVVTSPIFPPHSYALFWFSSFPPIMLRPTHMALTTTATTPSMPSMAPVHLHWPNIHIHIHLSPISPGILIKILQGCIHNPRTSRYPLLTAILAGQSRPNSAISLRLRTHNSKKTPHTRTPSQQTTTPTIKKWDWICTNSQTLDSYTRRTRKMKMGFFDCSSSLLVSLSYSLLRLSEENFTEL